jgi:hypothetical protein
MDYKTLYNEKLNLWKKRKHFKKEIIFVLLILVALIWGITSSVLESGKVRERCLRRINYLSSGIYRLTCDTCGSDDRYKTFKFQDEAIEYCRMQNK